LSSTLMRKPTMRSPLKASSRLAAPFVLATAALSLFALHCSSDDGSTQNGGSAGTTTTPTSGAGGQATQGGSAAGGVTTAGGTSAGSSTGGVTTAGTAGTGSPGGGGAGGSAAGSGGGGTGGAGGGGGTGGGGGVTFAQVKALLAMSCKGSMCHDAGNAKQQIDWTTSDGLYMRLTTAIPDNIAHCVGNVPVVPGMPAQSLLVQAVTGPGKITCNKKGGGTEMIARMPDDCPTDRPCLTPEQIKLISDWVAAGAPM
jgi:hypothetical protein